MTLPEILKELEPYTGKFPEPALRAAIEQREAIIPELLRVLEEVAQDPVTAAARKGYMLPTFAIFLLAQFRERRAFPLLARICAAPGEVPFDLFGDTVTEGLCRILASIYNGDPTPLQRLVEDEMVNEFVRSAALDTFLVLEATGQMPRPEVIAYFTALFRGRLERKASFAWDGLVCACANLPAPELIEDIRQAYRDALIDPTVADLEGIERDLSRSAKETESTSSGAKSLIDDTINEMEWWHCFHADEDGPGGVSSEPLPAVREPAEPAPFSDEVFEPFVRDAPKVGRNDPCPCGSGKKYKKCCLGKE